MAKFGTYKILNCATRILIFCFAVSLSAQKKCIAELDNMNITTVMIPAWLELYEKCVTQLRDALSKWVKIKTLDTLFDRLIAHYESNNEFDTIEKYKKLKAVYLPKSL